MTDPPSGPKPAVKSIRTEGDKKKNMINALSDLGLVTSELTSSINHLKDFVSDEVDEGGVKSLIMRQIRLLVRASELVEAKVSYVASQTSLSSLATRQQQRKRANVNYDNKLESKLKRTRHTNYIKLEDNILAKLVQNSPPKSTAIVRTTHHRAAKTSTSLITTDILPTPKNGKQYNLREAFFILDDLDISTNKFYNLASTPNSTTGSKWLNCHKGTFYNRLNKYQNDGIIPDENDYGMRMGALPIIKIEEITKLNNDLKEYKGYAEKNEDLSQNIIDLSEKEKRARGDLGSTKAPCAATLALYQMLSTEEDPNIHLINDKRVKPKDPRRQTASMSVRNLASHIAAISYANFIPSETKWSGPKGLPRGCYDLIDIIKRVTGSHVKPILPAFLVNEDCTSQYYCSGSTKGDTGNNGWSRVTTESLESRDMDSIWSDDKTQNKMARSIRVKFACGGTGGGYLYPICILVSNLSKEHLPKDEFKVIPIEGLSVNGHLDPRSKEIGYLCLMQANVSQRQFFEWFYKNITCPTILNIRQRYNPTSTPLSEEDPIPADQKFVLWGDSDIPYLKEMMSPGRIAEALQIGLCFGKIGAKITEDTQPMDLGPFFKIINHNGKVMTSEDIVKPLSILVDIIFKNLRANKELLLPTLKEAALKDLLVTAPDLMNSAFLQKTIVDSFVSAGMLDKRCKRCPDLDRLINLFKVPWGKIKGGQNWFLDMLPTVIAEMYSEGEVSEKFYDEMGFPVDCDKKGTTWLLKSNADHLSRSKVLYHPTVVEKRKEELRICSEAISKKVTDEYEAAVKVFELNIDCEKEIISKMVNLLNSSVTREDVSVDMASLEVFDKLKVKHLSAFYRCRVQEDLYERIKLPSKGNINKVITSQVDKTTNGPFLIKLCFDVKTLPVVAKRPILKRIDSASSSIKEPSYLTICDTPNNWNTLDVSVPYVIMLKDIMKNVDEGNHQRILSAVLNDISPFKKYSELLGRKLIKRLGVYLSKKLPLHRTDLLSNQHWVWLSFKKHIKLIAAAMITFGHVMDEKELVFKGDDESLLSNTTNFHLVDLTGEHEMNHGNYVILDSKRGEFVYNGVANFGYKKNWEKHALDSMLKDYSKRKDKFSAAYPNTDLVDMSESANVNVKGRFEDLLMFSTIEVKGDQIERYLEHFDINEDESKRINVLINKGGPNNMPSKKIKHLLEMFCMAYTLAINPARDMSGMIPCSWQMELKP